MFRVASRTLRIVAVLAVLLALAPVAWADPGRGRDEARSNGSERAQDRHAEEEHAQDGRSEEDHAEEEQAEASEQDETASDGSTPSDEAQPSDEEAGSHDASRSDEAQPSDEEPDSEARSEARGSDAPARAARLLDVSSAAAPSRIAPGETSVVTVAATNVTSQTLDPVDLWVELPGDLELVSSDPAGTTTDDALVLALGPLAAGDTARVELVVRGVPAPGGAAPIRFALIAGEQVLRHELVVEVDAAETEGLQLAQTGPLLVQVGDSESFSLTVSNTTGAPLREVAVVAKIAPELDVVGVTPVVEADAVQLGSSTATEDVVWIFHELEAGESVDLPWTARAVAPGDLEATSSTVALVDGDEVAAADQRTYLGFVEGLEVERDDSRSPLVRRRVVTKMVPVSRQAAAAVAASGLLPVTGASPGILLGVALALILLGLISLWMGGQPRSVRRGGVIALSALLLTTAACISAPESSSPDATATDAGESAGPEAEDEIDPDETGVADENEPDDEVLGVRVERDPPADAGGAEGLEDPLDAAPPTPETAASEVVFREVTTVESVLVPPSALPVRELGDRSGDNAMAIVWSPPGDLTATSSVIVRAGAVEELLVSLEPSGPGLTATVTLRNLAEAERLAVRGRLLLEVAHGGGSSRLSSEAIDVVLDPGAEVSADFTFSLPAGSYSLRGGFEED